MYRTTFLNTLSLSRVAPSLYIWNMGMIANYTVINAEHNLHHLWLFIEIYMCQITRNAPTYNPY